MPKPTFFENNNYTHHMRQTSLRIFQGKLNDIRTRKNKYGVNNFRDNIPPSLLSSTPMTISLPRDYNMIKNNIWLGSRLGEIKSRKNKIRLNDNGYFMEKRHQANSLVRTMRQKEIKEQNDIFGARLAKKGSMISHIKLEEEFRKTKNFPGNYARYHTETTMLKSFSKPKKESLPSIFSTKYDTLNNNNNDLNENQL